MTVKSLMAMKSLMTVKSPMTVTYSHTVKSRVMCDIRLCIFVHLFTRGKGRLNLNEFNDIP